MGVSYSQHRIKIGCFNVNMSRKSGTKTSCVKSDRSELKTRSIAFLLLLSCFLFLSNVPFVNSCLQAAALTSTNFKSPGQSLETFTLDVMSNILVPSSIAFLHLLLKEPSPHRNRDQDDYTACEPDYHAWPVVGGTAVGVSFPELPGRAAIAGSHPVWSPARGCEGWTPLAGGMQLRESSLTSLSQHSLLFSLQGQVGMGVKFREMGYVQVRNKMKEVSVTAETKMFDNNSLMVFSIRGHDQVFILCITALSQVSGMSDTADHQAGTSSSPTSEATIRCSYSAPLDLPRYPRLLS